MMAGVAPSPTIHLHPCSCADSIHPTTYAVTCPAVMNSILSVTSLPRNAEGDSSEIYLSSHQPMLLSASCAPKRSYSGTTRLAPPTANPTILRPPTIPHTLSVHACHNAPMVNSTSATRMAVFLPTLSARTAVMGLAMRANKLVQDVTRLLSTVVKGRAERSEPIDTRVEEMTPVLCGLAQPLETRRLLRSRVLTHIQTAGH